VCERERGGGGDGDELIGKKLKRKNILMFKGGGGLSRFARRIAAEILV
jgi:hypothetical protein